MVRYIKEAIEALDGMRKLLLCVVVVIPIGVPLLLLHYITGDNWASVATIAISSYCAGNSAERWITAHYSKVDNANL